MAAKLTQKQREEIVAIAALRHGPYPVYPCEYIAALYGVSSVWVSQLVGKRQSRRYSRDLRLIGLRQGKLENSDGQSRT